MNEKTPDIAVSPIHIFQIRTAPESNHMSGIGVQKKKLTRNDTPKNYKYIDTNTSQGASRIQIAQIL